MKQVIEEQEQMVSAEEQEPVEGTILASVDTSTPEETEVPTSTVTPRTYTKEEVDEEKRKVQKGRDKDFNELKRQLRNLQNEQSQKEMDRTRKDLVDELGEEAAKKLENTIRKQIEEEYGHKNKELIGVWSERFKDGEAHRLAKERSIEERETELLECESPEEMEDKAKDLALEERDKELKSLRSKVATTPRKTAKPDSSVSTVLGGDDTPQRRLKQRYPTMFGKK